jgi:hypothetical protein
MLLAEKNDATGSGGEQLRPSPVLIGVAPGLSHFGRLLTTQNELGSPMTIMAGAIRHSVESSPAGVTSREIRDHITLYKPDVPAKPECPLTG